jgi:hypothetical protein
MVSKRKLTTLVIALVAIIVAVTIISYVILRNPLFGNVGISGVYDSLSNPSEYLEIRSDGTLYAKLTSYGMNGTWKSAENNRILITLHTYLGDWQVGYMRIEGDKLIADDGSVFVKRR